MKLRFREEDLHRFSAASLDFNPLHLSEDYARKTASGERVVYGILGFLSCLKAVPLAEGQVPSAIRIDFKGQLLLNVDYIATTQQESDSSFRVVVMDGASAVMRIRLQCRAGVREMTGLSELGTAPLTEARSLQVSDFVPGLSFRGRYSPGLAAYLELLNHLEIDRARWGDTLPIAAICSSYVTGMELPGERANYSGLKLQLEPGIAAPAEFQITLENYDDQFGLAHSRFSLASNSTTFAHGEIAAIARLPRGQITTVGLNRTSRSFQGKTALVIGASRGLGSAIALDLTAEGATVIGVYSRSRDDADELVRASHDLPGRLIMERGDASDPNWCAGLKSRLTTEFGELNLLVCNAAPALQPLRVEPASYDRIVAYLHQGFALLAAPLSNFLESVAASSGCVLTISSKAVENPPETWPHYVALKGAAESLIQAAAAGNPKVTFWIARPGKILTDLTNTPMGRLDAEDPQAVSRRILDQVLSPASTGNVHYWNSGVTSNQVET